MHLSRHIAALTSAGLLAGAALTTTASAAPAGFELTAGSVSSVVSVSPDVYFDSATSTYYLYTTGMRVGVYSSSDGESWSAVPGASTPTGPYFDPSVISMADGTYRMYLTERVGTGGSPCSGKQLRYATSSDLITWSLQSGVLLSDLGCGVPDVAVVPDGYLLSYVRGGDGGHGTYQATSSDGLTWTELPGLVTPADMVDPSVVYLGPENWIMLTADFPSSGGGGKEKATFRQSLYVATSTDGREWDFGDVEPLYVAPAPAGAFDPDAVLLPDGSVRVWWAQGDSFTARVASGSLTIPGPSPEPVVAKPGKPVVKKSGKRVTITWTYSGDASELDGYRVQMRASGVWATVATVTASKLKATISSGKVPVRKGQRLQTRVVAYALTDSGEITATSPTSTIKSWK